MKYIKLLLLGIFMFAMSCGSSYKYVATETVIAIDRTLVEKRGHRYYKIITDKGHVVLTQDDLEVGDRIIIKVRKNLE